MENVLRKVVDKFLDPAELKKKYDTLKSKRSTYDSRWQAIQKHVAPNARDYTSRGSFAPDPQTSGIGNTTGHIGVLVDRRVSMLSSEVCDPTVKWMSIKFGDARFDRNHVASQWLRLCEESLYSLFADPTTKFYPSTTSFHFDWYTIGTACRHVTLRRDNGKISFDTISMQDIYIEPSAYGDVESVFRRFNLTAKQATGLWGENLHQSYLQESIKSGQTSQKYEFFEAVIPNPIKSQIPSLDWLSCVIDCRYKAIVDVGLHVCNPYVIARYFVAPGETYGRSLIWNLMPDIETQNQLNIRMLQSVDYATMPVTAVKDLSSIRPEQIAPGGFVQGLDENGRPTFQPISFGGDINAALAFYSAKKNEIIDAIGANEPLPPSDAVRSATEFNQRKLIHFVRMRPAIVRLEAEDLQNTITASLKLLEQKGELPAFPYEDAKIDPAALPDPIKQLRVSFSGQLRKMQMLQSIQECDMFLEKIGLASNIKPDVLDVVNMDNLVLEEARIYDLPAGVINSSERVSEIREERARQQQADQLAQQQAIMLDNMIKLRGAGVNE